MNETKLKSLGVSEDAIKAIMDEWNRTNGALSKEVEGQRAQVKEYEKQLKELEKLKGDNEQLSTKLADIQASQKAAQEAFTKEMNEYKRSQAIKYAIGTIKDGKPYDPAIILSLLDTSKVSVDDNGNVTGGLDDQIANLRKDKAFLFEAGTQRVGTTPPSGAPAQPEASSTVGSIGARLAAQAIAASKTV